MSKDAPPPSRPPVGFRRLTEASLAYEIHYYGGSTEDIVRVEGQPRNFHSELYVRLRETLNGSVPARDEDVAAFHKQLSRQRQRGRERATAHAITMRNWRRLNFILLLVIFVASLLVMGHFFRLKNALDNHGDHDTHASTQNSVMAASGDHGFLFVAFLPPALAAISATVGYKLHNEETAYREKTAKLAEACLSAPTAHLRDKTHKVSTAQLQEWKRCLTSPGAGLSDQIKSTTTTATTRPSRCSKSPAPRL